MFLYYGNIMHNGLNMLLANLSTNNVYSGFLQFVFTI